MDLRRKGEGRCSHGRRHEGGWGEGGLVEGKGINSVVYILLLFKGVKWRARDDRMDG